MDKQTNPSRFVGTLRIGSIRINAKCERCGRPFVARDFDIDDEAVLTLTCARCHFRPFAIELEEEEQWDEPPD